MTKKFKKTALITIGICFGAILLIILFISPIAKYLIEKYDVKFIGREITMDWAYVNPFTGYVHLQNLKIYEPDGDTLFFSARGVSANFAMRKLLNKTYEISEINLNQPIGIVIQNKKELNFGDIIKKFSSKSTSDIPKAPVHFNILNISIERGVLKYRESQIPISYSLKEINIKSSGKWWDKDSIVAAFSFIPSIGTGKVNGNFEMNFTNLNYRLNAVIQKYDLDFLQQYLNDITNYGSFRANVDADFRAKGNFKDQENISASGKLAFTDFHFGKNPKEDFASFQKLKIGIIELSPKNHKYSFDSILLAHPFFKYERYDQLDNIQKMFGKKGSKIATVAADEAEFNLVIEIARYVKVLAKNFFRSNYKINHLDLTNGDFAFNDFSTSEKFSIGLDPLTVFADSIDKEHKRVKINFVSSIQPYGKANITLSINPKDSSDFDMIYDFDKIPTTLFNPYLLTYTSFPLDRGTIAIKGTWNVRNGEIVSDNHLTVIDPRVTNRVRNKDNNWLPLRLIMAFVRERGNVIDYEVPITGNLNNPKFHLKDVLFDVVTNIFVKPATTPYRIQVRNIEQEIEKSLSFKWDMRSCEVDRKQEKFISKLADFLKNTPEASITITPQNYLAKEKEHILFYEAKKKYMLFKNPNLNANLSENDSIFVTKMSVKDTLFVQYLTANSKDTMLFTIQEKCARMVSENVVNEKWLQLKKERESAFLAVFKQSDVDSHVKFLTGKTTIPYNGFSFYRIEYKDEFPEALMKAYREMHSLNAEAPRNKFNKERSQIRNSRIQNRKLKNAAQR
ncbi:MAG: DUF748 domain-containing protein [Bacteroidetes bacterium]|nr:DUF748 domain-containing protein [Bacteroidota bacterium]